MIIRNYHETMIVKTIYENLVFLIIKHFHIDHIETLTRKNVGEKIFGCRTVEITLMREK